MVTDVNHFFRGVAFATLMTGLIYGCARPSTESQQDAVTAQLPSQNGTTGSDSQRVGYAAGRETKRSAEPHAKGAGL